MTSPGARLSSSPSGEQEGSTGMEERKHAQVPWKVALAGMLMAVLLSQGIDSLRCYHCIDVNDGGCTNRIKIEECTLPRNVCQEAVSIVVIGTQNVSTAIKGCDIGRSHNHEYQSGVILTSYRRVTTYTCITDLCNSMVPRDFLAKPPIKVPDSSGPGTLHCYTCVSTSPDKCALQNPIRCRDDSTVCYQGIGHITLGADHRVTLTYYKRECAPFCLDYFNEGSKYEKRNDVGTCCESDLCNNVVPTTKATTPATVPTIPTTNTNSGPRTATSVAPHVVSALVAIISL